MFEKIVKHHKRLNLGIVIVLVVLAAIGFVVVGQNSTIVTIPAVEPVRLHIIANSDSPQDQTLKLVVRDKIVEELTPLLLEAKDRDEAAAIVQANIPRMEQIAQEVTASAGYSAKGYYGRFGFPDRTYGELFLPAGDYDALRLVLGAGEGKNWWCVLFPPLCFMDGASKASSEVVPAMGGGEQGVKIKVRFRLTGSLDDAK